MPESFDGLTLPAVFFAVSLFGTTALGCSCVEPPPPCQAIGQTQLVFLGTVTEISKQAGAFETDRMSVDRTFKGDLKKTIELFNDGMCDGPDFQVGKQYLMYTYGIPGGGIPARGCTRSRSIEYADEDLEFLKQYVAGKVTTHIDGTVRFRPDEPDDSLLGDEGRTPMKDVRVKLSGSGTQFQATTNSIGRYAFSGVPPGNYTIDADLPGFRLDWAPDNLALAANGCVQADILMKVDRRVQGIVRDNNGDPVSGALVEMVSANRDLKKWEQPVLLDISGDDGQYVIDGIPPGDYLLGVNVASTPTKEHPYPPTYYPNTPDPALALRIGVVIGASVQNFDLVAPHKLPLITIHGTIQLSDGKPPLVQDRPQVRIKEPGLYGQIEMETIEIDADGRFQFELCEGVKYSAFAFSGPIRTAIYSAPMEFTPTKEHDQLVLTLDKSQAEFNKLRPK